MRILKIESLPNTKENWVDRDVIMLHACFQILKDCIEKEEVDTSCDYETYKFFIYEARFLYTWWELRQNPIRAKYLLNEDLDTLMLIRLIKIRSFLWT